ncbi:transposase [Coralloluteibacterium thermophilus]|uniref:Transposase n=1 Tax=Coralloluteibacterium thermophilum TaxID=2707049 RepID=A0ABV9NJS0_9GAMM
MYLLTAVVAGRHPVFADPTTAAGAARVLADRDTWLDARLLCWVLMPDHWHGLLVLGNGSTLAACMQRAKGRAARAVNRLRGTSGALWMPGYHDRALRREDDVRTVARYVVANPLRAGLVTRLGDYPYWDAVWLGGADGYAAGLGDG